LRGKELFMADIDQVSVYSHCHQTHLRRVAKFNGSFRPKERLKKMIGDVSMLVNESSGSIIFGAFEAAFAENFSDSFSAGLISRENFLPIDLICGDLAVALIFFDQTLQLLGAKGLSIGIVLATLECRAGMGLRGAGASGSGER
jgi:hypothetical protein